MSNYQCFYGCDMSDFVKRERFSMSIHPELLARVDSLSAILGANRPDTIEVIIAFYFAYVAAAKSRAKRPPMSE
jgi:metal-responsive CopG/Arc/MetJ family transcriptional regulator